MSVLISPARVLSVVPFFQETALLSWWEGLDDAGSLDMKTPAFSRPSLQNMPLLSGHDFRAVLEKMTPADDRQHLKVLASLRKVDGKFGPLYYDGCGGSGSKGRMCLTRLDADGTCRVCGQPSNVVPVLMMDRAGFEADDGATFRLTAFGGVATSIVGITGEDAQALEAVSVKEGDSSRSAVVNKIKWSFGRSFEVGVTANRNVTEDGKPFLNAKIFEVALATTSLDPKVCFNVL